MSQSHTPKDGENIAIIGILANTAVTLIISMYIIYKSGEFNNV
jgi:hypothetical protein